MLFAGVWKQPFWERNEPNSRRSRIAELMLLMPLFEVSCEFDIRRIMSRRIKISCASAIVHRPLIWYNICY